MCRPQERSVGEEGGSSSGQRGGRVMVARAYKGEEGVGSHLQCLSVRTGGSYSLGHLEDKALSGHDSMSPLCVNFSQV